MIPALNKEALKLELECRGETIIFTGHFTPEIVSKMSMKLETAMRICLTAGFTEATDDAGQSGAVDYNPQTTAFFFPPNKGFDTIIVDSEILKKQICGKCP